MMKNRLIISFFVRLKERILSLFRQIKYQEKKSFLSLIIIFSSDSASIMFLAFIMMCVRFFYKKFKIFKKRRKIECLEKSKRVTMRRIEWRKLNCSKCKCILLWKHMLIWSSLTCFAGLFPWLGIPRAIENIDTIRRREGGGRLLPRRRRRVHRRIEVNRL